MFNITRIVLTAAAMTAGLAGARADDSAFVGDGVPPQAGGAFLSNALYPEMPGANAPVRPSIGADGTTPAALPFTPHFGLSITGAQVDGIFFSPADGIELTAKPGLDGGVRGLLGVTIRF